MKRRTYVDSMRLRRSAKKLSPPRVYEGLYMSVVVYVKLLLLWVCIMGGDFLLDFRLEYLYPIYLLLHNSYEAYKFQGVAFALLLVCIVVSVDVICLGVLPAPWLFLLGSLAVWGQISWSLTPMGPFFILPVLLYIDGKPFRPFSSGGGGGSYFSSTGSATASGSVAASVYGQPLYPLAAHCVGFPLVSLGFGLKSFISSRLRSRTRSEVARQNDILYSCLWDALPFTSLVSAPAVTTPPITSQPPPQIEAPPFKKPPPPQTTANNNHTTNHTPATVVTPRRKSLEYSSEEARQAKVEESSTASPLNNNNSLGGCCVQNGGIHHNGGVGLVVEKKKKKDECCYKLESEVRKLRSELHVMKSAESELRGQIFSHQSSERNLRSDLASVQGEHESLQLKYAALVSKGQEERQSYEKRLNEERRAKEAAVTKQKKASLDCPGDCKRKLREAEREKESLRRDLKLHEEKMARVERELQNVKSTLLHEQKSKESSSETARLVSLLTACQDQNAHLESSLSAETRLKLDLFSALGEARRQLSIRDNLLKSKEDEVEELKNQLMNLLTSSSSNYQNNHHPHHHHQLQQQPRLKVLGHQHALGTSVTAPEVSSPSLASGLAVGSGVQNLISSYGSCIGSNNNNNTGVEQ